MWVSVWWLRHPVGCMEHSHQLTVRGKLRVWVKWRKLGNSCCRQWKSKLTRETVVRQAGLIVYLRLVGLICQYWFQLPCVVFSGEIHLLRLTFREVSGWSVGGSLASPVQQKMGGARKWRVFAKTQKKSLAIIAAQIIIVHIQVLFYAFCFCFMLTLLSQPPLLFLNARKE